MVVMRVRASSSSATSKRSSQRKPKDHHRDDHRNVSGPHRTTVTLSPESQEIVKRFRSANGTSTSAAIDQIIQQSEPKPSRLKEVNGFLVLSTPAEQQEDVRYVTLEDIKRAEDEFEREYVERILNRDRRPEGQKRKAGTDR